VTVHINYLKKTPGEAVDLEPAVLLRARSRAVERPDARPVPSGRSWATWIDGGGPRDPMAASHVDRGGRATWPGRCAPRGGGGGGHVARQRRARGSPRGKSP
jgi:hypothetical protein